MHSPGSMQSVRAEMQHGACAYSVEHAGLQYEHGQSGTMRPLQYAPVANGGHAEAAECGVLGCSSSPGACSVWTGVPSAWAAIVAAAGEVRSLAEACYSRHRSLYHGSAPTAEP